MVLCRVTSIPRKDLAPSFCFNKGYYTIIKISAINTSFVVTEAQLYAELVDSGAWAVPPVAYSESGGGNKDTKDILGPLWKERRPEIRPYIEKEEPSAENSIVNRQRKYLVFATVGTPLISSRFL